MSKVKTLDQLKSQIESKQKTLAEIQEEIRGLQAEAKTMLAGVAGEFGLAVVGQDRQQKRTPKTKAQAVADTADWLKSVLASGAIPESELRTKFANAGIGKRLRVAKYKEDGLIKIRNGQVELAK